MLVSAARRDEVQSGPDPRIRAAVGGDRGATQGLVAQLLPRVRNLVRYLVRGDSDVDDVAQDALVAIVRGLSTYRGEGTIESWADRVTARVTFAAIKKRRTDEARTAGPPDLVPVGDVAPDEYVARRRAVEKLDALPDAQRHVLVLHHVVGLSVAEIAEELGAPAETVRSRLRLGIARLRSGTQDGGSDG